MDWRAHILLLEQFINSSFRCWGKGLLAGAWATSCCSKASPWGEREAKFRSRRSRMGRGCLRSQCVDWNGESGKAPTCNRVQRLQRLPNVIKTTNCPWCTQNTQQIHFNDVENAEKQPQWAFTEMNTSPSQYTAFSFWCEYFILHNKMSLLVNCEFIMELISVTYKYQLTISF